MSAPYDDDSEALFACAAHGGALATVIAIDGSWSRRLGAQLAVLPDGTMRGSLADGCLERAIAGEARTATAPRLLRYGKGSPFVDIRLPCGSGVDVWLDPAPPRAALAAATGALARREVARLAVGGGFVRRYLPRLRLVVLGSGPQVAALAKLATLQGVELVIGAPLGEGGDVALALGQQPLLALDPWTAVAVLFHDHEWERGLLPWALASPAFYVGAQGGKLARENRQDMLAAAGLTPHQAGRIKSPIGAFPGARTPGVLALAVLAEIVAEYEAMVEKGE